MLRSGPAEASRVSPGEVGLLDIVRRLRAAAGAEPAQQQGVQQGKWGKLTVNQKSRRRWICAKSEKAERKNGVRCKSLSCEDFITMCRGQLSAEQWERTWDQLTQTKTPGFERSHLLQQGRRRRYVVPESCQHALTGCSRRLGPWHQRSRTQIRTCRRPRD